MVRKGSFVVAGGTGFCNAVRRTLLSDVKSEAPFQVEFRDNTSCQPDEFIAHRIGLIPFRRVGNGDTLELCVEDRPAFASDFTGPAFSACVNVEVMNMRKGQRLDVTVRFDEQAASKHGRYAKCAAVGMKRIDNDGRHRIVFETIDDSDPRSVLSLALDALETRVDDALADLSQRDLPPPKSMC